MNTCIPWCGQVLYKFRALNRPRKVTFVPPRSQDDPRDYSDQIEELKQKETKGSHAYRRGNVEARETDLSVEYPKIA